MIDWLASIGRYVRAGLANLGLQMRTFGAMLIASAGLIRRIRLVTDQVHFIGNYSLVIIAVSGLFVGFVLGLQGYYTLNKYGSEQALGLRVSVLGHRYRCSRRGDATATRGIHTDACESKTAAVRL